MQVLAQNLQWLIGGIIITENVFAYPGIGSTLVIAVQNRDVTLVQSVAMLIAIVYIAAQPARRPDRDAARAQAAGARMMRDAAALPAHGAPARSARRSSRSCCAVALLRHRTSRRTTRDAPIGAPLARPERQRRWLGTDFLGRDVLSRLLYGGRSVIGLAAAATVLAYLIGLTIGLIAGYSRSFVDPLLMRTVDVMLAFPPLLFVLVLISGAGTGVTVVVIAVAAIQAPEHQPGRAHRDARSWPCAATSRRRSRAARAPSR